MIFIADYEGKIINSTPETVYQGSAGANTIYLVAPFEGAVKLNFVLPNGLILDPYIMTPKDTFSNLTDPTTGSTLRAFSYSISNEITQAAGVVKLRFTFYSSTDYEGATVLATSQTSFVVSSGVPINADDIEADDTEATILAAFSTIVNRLANGYYSARAIYRWNKTFTYNPGEITYYPIGDYGALVWFSMGSSSDVNPKPFITSTDDDGNETYEVNSPYWYVVADFNKISENFYQLIKDQVILAESWAIGGTGERDGEDTDNSKYYAEQAADSATAAADSAIEATEKVESIELKMEGLATNDLATQTSAGLMSAADKRKLDGFSNTLDTTDIPLASWETDGLMSMDDKKKLDALTFTTVTFMIVDDVYTRYYSYDGSAINEPAVPTREGYHFNGWALTEDGDLVEFPYTPTEDVTIYSLWTKVHTVTFNNKGSIYATEEIIDGGSVSAPDDPTNGTYIFSGWALTEDGDLVEFPYTPTEDITFYAVWIKLSTVLNDTSWKDISYASTMGIGSSYWSVGDRHSVKVNGTVGLIDVDETFYVAILGFDHNSKLEGTGIQFGNFYLAQTGGKRVALVDDYYGTYKLSTKCFSMNHWGGINYNYYTTNYGGWKGCDLRYDILGSTDVAPSDYGTRPVSGRTGYDATENCAINPVENTLMAALEEDLRKVMKPITKYTDNVGGGNSDVSSYVTASIDYLPLMSKYECYGSVGTLYNVAENDYQKIYDFFGNGNQAVTYSYVDTDTLVVSNTRSPGNNAYTFCSPNATIVSGISRYLAAYSYGLGRAVFMV